MSPGGGERRQGDKAVLVLLVIVLLVQLLQGIELHDVAFDVDAAADEIITGLPKYTEAAKAGTEFVLVLGGLVIAARSLLGTAKRRRE